MDLFDNRKQIGMNLTSYMFTNGYSKTSFSKLVGISRPTLYRILRGDSPEKKRYEEQLAIITSALNLPADYFLKDQS
ncbi:MAG TPA: helix-turn-helix transcriptional regulator [Bacillus sp. (in: firmicutes)]|nr:helix-turn-helix transcriptional regulator [Bacillus sp. (in: firmicutes)]